MGFAEPKAHLGAEHLHEATRLAWRHTRWPQMRRQAKQRQALWLLGAEASCAPWGAWRSPGAPQGQPPEVPTSGNRQASKVFGLMDYFSGPLFDNAHAGRCNAESAQAFVLDGLSQTTPHGVVM